MSDNDTTLDPISPSDSQERFLDRKAMDCSEKTARAYQSRLNFFVQWCRDNGLTNLNDLRGRHLQEYRLWRQADGELKPLSLNQQMKMIRVFLKLCGSIEAVDPELHNKVLLSNVPPDQQRSDETFSTERAQTLLEYLSTYHFASVEHAVIALLWETGVRLGAANGLDVEDVDFGELRLDIAHRPEGGTSLKNGRRGERPVAITPELGKVLAEYLEHDRNEFTEESGREPLFTTTVGRMHRNTMRMLVYRTTAPCFRNEPCDGCTGTSVAKCPDAVSPHVIRRGSITHYLANDVPVEVVGDRMNVSRKVLEKHYDSRSEDVKLEQRRGYPDNV